MTFPPSYTQYTHFEKPVAKLTCVLSRVNVKTHSDIYLKIQFSPGARGISSPDGVLCHLPNEGTNART